MKKEVSPLISTVIVVLLAFSIAAVISPWAFRLVTKVTNQTESDTNMQLRCQNTAYDFDTNYGTMGLTWNFSGSDDTLTAKIVNTGNINLYNFTFELVVNTTSGLEIKRFSPNATNQITPADPLEPGESSILTANISEDITGTLEEVKVMNPVCPGFYAVNREI